MVYIPAEESADGIAKVVYTSKDGKTREVFNALDWLARLVTHIPGRCEQTVRYYGWYSNKTNRHFLSGYAWHTTYGIESAKQKETIKMLL